MLGWNGILPNWVGNGIGWYTQGMKRQERKW